MSYKLYSESDNRWARDSWGSWGGARDGSGSWFSVITAGTLNVSTEYTASYWVRRSWLRFNLAGITEEMVDSGVALNLYFLAGATGSNRPYVNLQSSSSEAWPVTDNTQWLAQNADMGTKLSDFYIVADGWNVWTFNAAGEAFLKTKLGGYVMFFLGHVDDVDNDPTTGTRTLSFYNKEGSSTYQPSLEFIMGPSAPGKNIANDMLKGSFI